MINVRRGAVAFMTGIACGALAWAATTSDGAFFFVLLAAVLGGFLAGLGETP